MPKRWWEPLVIALRVWLVMTALTGLAYPAVIACLGETCFSHRVNGGMVEHAGRTMGAEQIGQPFTNPGYFWSRPSATAPNPYNAAASSGSNLAPSSPTLRTLIQQRVAALQSVDSENPLPIPVDLVTASGSGLDPDISPAAARYQVRRVARMRHLPVEAVSTLVEGRIEGRQWGVFGEPRVNVLQLNLALDDLAGGPPAAARD